MPAELTSSVQAPGIGSSTSITALTCVADRLAVLDRDRGAVGAVGHDLHGRPLAPEHRDAHEFVAHVGERGRDDGGQPGFQAR